MDKYRETIAVARLPCVVMAVANGDVDIEPKAGLVHVQRKDPIRVIPEMCYYLCFGCASLPRLTLESTNGLAWNRAAPCTWADGTLMAYVELPGHNTLQQLTLYQRAVADSVEGRHGRSQRQIAGQLGNAEPAPVWISRTGSGTCSKISFFFSRYTWNREWHCFPA